MIKVKNVSKVYRNKKVLNDISFCIDEPGVYGFKGRNGSGKTLLFKALLGLITLTEGSVDVHGKIIGRDISFPEETGFLIEYPSFLPNHTGFKNLEILASINNSCTKEEIKNVLEEVGLDSNNKDKVKKYSLGMKQRLGLAQSIMENPEILIWDEPTNALDEAGVEFLQEKIIDFKNKGKTILVSSHDSEFLREICQKIFVLDNGKLIDSFNVGENA
ncbi:ATP-binding cassette domain-containing protein [Listeria grandensis]|uniref:ATP-binding cassette domain-containing protein n=1 Tax=Listeria grandensis TaxID=1494963 RepID=A0A7X1CP62_9LIST|nr:ATP-binding cassette domain-containing protein [Listeria grandensis]MBC1935636.1 ATP-binding cassette domain-containing protein [Listeria grandensis]